MEEHIIEMTSRALGLIVLVSLPAVATATIFGLGVSLMQALTQIQEQTLSFAVKLIAVFIVLAFTLRWAGSEVKEFAILLFDSFPSYLRRQ